MQATRENGVRFCPWDEKSFFIPILCKETQEIRGDGKKKLGDRDSYDLTGEREWFRVDEFDEFDGLRHVYLYAKKANLRCLGYIDSRDGHEWFQLTECMMAFYLFTYLGSPEAQKVCARELTSFLKLMRCDDIINVYTSGPVAFPEAG